jgi:5-methylcytosine-specific restriction protein A
MKLSRLPPRFGPAPSRNGWTAEGRGSAQERGYGWEWRKLRNSVMERDCGLCQPCNARGKVTEAVAVDHIVNKARGGDDAPSNLQAICGPCHAAKTALEAHGGG